jgi:hypothetical protein
MQFNIPRVPVEQTEDLTEYEFEYELILRQEYYEYLKELRQNDPVDMSQGSVNREMRTDPEVYDALKKKIDAGDHLNFTLPDTSNLPKMSEILAMRQGASEQTIQSELEPVNPEEIFSRVLGKVGGSRRA